MQQVIQTLGEFIKAQYNTKTGASNRKIDLGPAMMKPVNQEAPSKLENAIFELDGSKMVADNKKEVTVKTVTP